MKKRKNGFTIVELLVVIAIYAFLIGILLPAFSGRRKPARQMQNNTQVRGIHQSLVMYARSNRSQYPGISPKREVVAPTVEERFRILLEGGYFTADYAISPVERKEMWTTGEVTSANYSYAMLDITNGDEKAKRTCEWKENLNALAAVMGDRNVGEDGEGKVQSIHEKSKPGAWRGSVAWNDNHVVYESTHVLKTKFGKSRENVADNLFVADSDGPGGSCDALWIYSGQ